MKIALKSIIIILSLIGAFCFSQNTDSSDLLITKKKITIRGYNSFFRSSNRKIKIKLEGKGIHKIENWDEIQIKILDSNNVLIDFSRFSHSTIAVDEPRRVPKKYRDLKHEPEYRFKTRKNKLIIIKALRYTTRTSFTIWTTGYQLSKGIYDLFVEYNNGEMRSNQVKLMVK
ncbi:MAG TPA: hypothetical protein P5514_04765 [Bacteroidales bacterium]|nr:hypothetical protein [Bacteroidales bacterium]HRX96233.1 hypothetical protein [Bacteroidales bacterium]